MQSAIKRKSKGSDSNVMPHVNATVWTQPFNHGIFSSTFCFNCSKFSGKSVSMTFALKNIYIYIIQ